MLCTSKMAKSVSGTPTRSRGILVPAKAKHFGEAGNLCMVTQSLCHLLIGSWVGGARPQAAAKVRERVAGWRFRSVNQIYS